MRREREDRTESDTSPVLVSTNVDDRTGQPFVDQANQTPKTNKKETKIERDNPLCSDIPEWLQEFRENLVDESVPKHRDSHACSPHEISLEPTSKRSEDLGKHSVYTHFPKDRNCEIWQRTKITRAPVQKSQWPGLGHSMDPVVSVQKQNLTRNPEKLAKVLGAR